ncbi:hypothetical protein [Terrabacter sp. NPDC000476]|uniref:hypothetical protein n=1 Tax=Terrabacter sp. NPDC000476 TaxID=3154258 RepID=UPI00331C0F62
MGAVPADGGVGSDDQVGRPDPAGLVDRIGEVVLAVQGVTGLHGGPLGAAATYLPGRRVVGIRQRDDRTEVHVTVGSGRPVRQVADDVRRAVRSVVDLPVHVTVEDVTPDAPTDTSP